MNTKGWLIISVNLQICEYAGASSTVCNQNQAGLDAGSQEVGLVVVLALQSSVLLSKSVDNEGM